ncbi:lysis protein [Pseudomonas sp. FW306-02-F02-AA]|uniref:Lysis protein n=1 Tax=Pseudomonas fluorescens TaxID=294 RepID=A0A0N9VI78_PSEFL|nr:MULTISPECIES: lysis protein [Pseudomonas]ALH99526.1 lysis protein [Pseudomonas fluorescens]PMZ04620.1 lysis protein [Pseudomonas sp. FW306-02-F02-AB]PMZ07422.1 lysis protein [Pseudomonas sp. FW306-02-H06C]PMZ16656.1 lysis protein [Pseudomonas sp. FW306-02-F02-AA]PMZ19058.1 lysis protein [Pseudomonas sp. FW306-02-F08-AA]
MTIPPFRLALIVMLITALVPLYWFMRVVDQRDDALEDLRSVQSEVQGLREAARISGEMLAERDSIDLERTTDLNHALTENQGLRRAVDAGLKRLRIKATCPVAVPADSGAGRLADAGTAELTADARRDYFTLRDQLALSKQMILGLQQHVLRVCR